MNGNYKEEEEDYDPPSSDLDCETDSEGEGPSRRGSCWRTKWSSWSERQRSLGPSWKRTGRL